jgi:ArsR family transcriptional regulator
MIYIQILEYMNNKRIELLKIVSHPTRIKILEELSRGVKCVSDIEGFLDVRQANISQHLSLLRHSGAVDYYMDGRLRCYFLKDPMVPEILKVLKKNYTKDLPAPECCPVTKRGYTLAKGRSK